MSDKEIFIPPWEMHDLKRVRKLNLNKLETPCYVVDEDSLERNLKILASVKKRTGCKILLAQKGFSSFHYYPLIRKYLDGVCASGIFEAKLGREEFKKEIHIYGPAYSDKDFNQLLKISDHIILNSFSQLERFKPLMKKAKNVEFGIRINPEYSEIECDMYNPAGKMSRFGLKSYELKDKDLSIISGIHFHVLCEENSDTLERVLKHVEEKFGEYISLPNIKWVNFGGGHHITRNDYDVEKLVTLVNDFKKKYKKQVILEPGEAVALNAGLLVASVIDIKKMSFGVDVVILDMSASNHVPDVIEMPYRPTIIEASAPGKQKFTYRLGGPTCLSGDVIGDYSFEKPLVVGQKLIFCNMAIYTMVKNNTFNGVGLPSIYNYKKSGQIKLVKKFGYKDFKERLG